MPCARSIIAIPGIVGEVLTDARFTADIIADGVHLRSRNREAFPAAKGPEHAVLITDAIAAPACPTATIDWDPIKVDVKEGKCTADGKLAGSVLTMDRAVRNITQFSDWNLQDAVRAATLNPSRAAGLAQLGQLASGSEANIVVLSPSGEVRQTIVHGRV